MLVFKSIVTVEGMGRTLDPQFDMLAAGKDLVADLVKNQYSVQRLSRDALWIAKDLAALLQVLPRQLRWMFKKFNSNDFAFEIKVPEAELIRDTLDVNGKRQFYAILSGSLFVSGALSLSFQAEGVRRLGAYPVISVVFFGLATLVLLRAYWSKY
jgi:ubiquinone biosynthesis protein